MIMLEESIRNAAKVYALKPDASAFRTTIPNFLRGIWRRGGLAGSTPEEAFKVHIEVGNAQEGIMRVSVLVAITRPAEFIEICFQQKMREL